MDFYVYLHRKATTGEIFYVGKGQGNRAWEQVVGRSKHWKHVVAKHGRTVEMVADGLQEWYAFELEKDLIALYGRQDSACGFLVNLTDGGEGETGRTVSESSRQKISKANTGRVPSLEVRAKMSKAQRGRKHSETTLAKLKAAQQRRGPETYGHRPKVAVWAPGAGRFESIRAAVEWLKAKGVAACPSNIIKCCKGKIKISGGYVWQYA